MTSGSTDQGTALNRQQRIETALAAGLELQHLQVLDESHGHNVPDGAESHFKVVAVSEAFAGARAVQRHRMINELLAAEFAGGMHALAIHVYTAEEWQNRFQQAPMSPPCLGGENAGGESSAAEESASAPGQQPNPGSEQG